MRTNPPSWRALALAAALVSSGASAAGGQQPTTGTDSTRRATPRTSATSGGEVERGSGVRVTKDGGRSPQPMGAGTTGAGTSTPTPTATTTPDSTDLRSGVTGGTPSTTSGGMPPMAGGTVGADSMRAMAPSAGTMAGAMGGASGVALDAARAAAAPILASLQTDAHALALLHESNVGEMRAGERAQREAGDSAVRSFAAMMVAEHAALDQQGLALSQRIGVVPALPDSALPMAQLRELDALPAAGTSGAVGGTGAPMDSAMRAAVPGTPFDRAYVAQQVAAHARTLALVDAAIGKAQQADLRTTLQNDVRPKVAAHLEMAQALQQRIGGP